jgi:hypothetical protein
MARKIPELLIMKPKVKIANNKSQEKWIIHGNNQEREMQEQILGTDRRLVA